MSVFSTAQRVFQTRLDLTPDSHEECSQGNGKYHADNATQGRAPEEQ